MVQFDPLVLVPGLTDDLKIFVESAIVLRWKNVIDRVMVLPSTNWFDMGYLGLEYKAGRHEAAIARAQIRFAITHPRLRSPLRNR